MTALRADYRQTGRKRRDARSPERLLAHYTLERRLTDRLVAAPAAERTRVYAEVYAELFESLDDHPQKTARREADSARVARHMALLRPHLSSRTRYLEIGCGDAAVAFAAANRVATAYGLDVTDRLIPRERPANFMFVPTTGVDIALPDGSIDFAFSNQLMEHLHPDDAVAQLKEIRRVLAPGGLYRCCTPSRFTGPHDVSAYFDYEATGLHLKEYDYRSLAALFRAAGFTRLRFYVTGGPRQSPIPYALGRAAEWALSLLPKAPRARIARLPLVNQLMGLTVVAG